MADYKTTLNLPQTDFAMRAGLAKKEPLMLEGWQQGDLYGRIQEARKNATPFVLHDGPPYANGHLHHGHILNKILKDIVVKDRSMRGFKAAYVPGWDCHGLPIEVQVDKRLGKDKHDLSKAEIQKACRDYADEFIDIQREEFKRLGILGRWDEPYRTMNFAYEAQIIRELGKFAEQGLLYKGLRPVNWCMNHQTALAEAEVEYENHSSPSVYVAFELLDGAPLGLSAAADMVIWTTTPWTLPANLAIAVHPELDYIAYPAKGRLRIVAKDLAEAFCAAVGESYDEAKVVKTFKGDALENLRYRHPLFARESPVILGEHVTTEAGTGCVHTAPGHGGDDFEVGKRYNLDVLSPVNNGGVFTDAAGPFAGKHVFAANPDIIAALVEKGALLNSPDDKVDHRYAHCWRCHKPIILRATEQWWVAIDKPYGEGGLTLRERALKALGEVEWIPDWGEARLRGMLEARPDWCLSRQRLWGVPIAVLYCQKCEHPHINGKLLDTIAESIEKEGAGAWFDKSVNELVGDLACEKCGAKEFRKEEDILDVWFDSGVSFAAVVDREGLGHKEGPLVDLYLEGSDQHRGWFHTSLLCSLATREQPPYKTVLTHGFVVDGKGKKLSKSKGNFTDPFKTIAQNGAEIFRLWVAAEDYREDIRISNEILARLTDTYRKMRNTVRYMLGNLHDFDPNQDFVAAAELTELDRHMLGRAVKLSDKIQAAYRTYNFHTVIQAANEWCTVDLSAFYLDILKDRLYASAPKSIARRSAQSVMYIIVRDLLRLLAPVLAFTAEEAWGALPRLAGDHDSVHLALYPDVDEVQAIVALRNGARESEKELGERYDFLRLVRRQVNGVIEEARREKVIGSSVEAAVRISGAEADIEKLRDFGEGPLADLFIVSKVELQVGDGELTVENFNAPGRKCERCWLYREDMDPASAHPTLCARCNTALKESA